MTACLDLMCEWVHLYLDNTSEEIVNADVHHHGPFYSVCQAIFYVFVFRSKEIFEMKKGSWELSRFVDKIFGKEQRILEKLLNQNC